MISPILDHPRPVGASLAAATIPEAGDTPDHYRIDELTACTALAFIFRGTDLGSGRKVAINIPRVEAGGDPDFCACFVREEKIGGKLHHPGVISVLCDAERSQLYVVTQWVDGRSLRTVLDEQGRLSPDRAAHITANICDALYYVHSRGVVHRDLKPENVLLLTDDKIKLIDFGIAVAGGSQ